MISLVLALTLLSGAASTPDSLYSNVVVRTRETVSWIAIRHLGAYDPAIRDTLKMDNPSIPDLDKVAVGQTLRLRRSMDRRPLPPERQIAMASRQAVVTTLKGTGEVRLKSGQLVPLTANTFLATGDEIRLGAGSVAELVIDNQSILRLRENSRLRLLDIQGSTAEKGRKAGTRVALDQGALWVKVRKWAGPLVGFPSSPSLHHRRCTRHHLRNHRRRRFHPDRVRPRRRGIGHRASRRRTRDPAARGAEGRGLRDRAPGQTSVRCSSGSTGPHREA